MRENEFTRLRGEKVLLVPYERHHVQKYHGWMESDELRQLTASERLSLEEEYSMQRKWRESPDKCTFIILDRERYEQASNQDAVQREI
ncbi:N-acetyltransferase 9, partial [Elysia marginata]